MNLIEIYISKAYDFAVCVNNDLVYTNPIDFVDVIEVTSLLCKRYDIPSGDITLSIYKFFEDKIQELKAEKREAIMNQRFYTGVA
jgi:hypothetical protein